MLRYASSSSARATCHGSSVPPRRLSRELVRGRLVLGEGRRPRTILLAYRVQAKTDRRVV